MKKLSVILISILMVAAAFADEPAYYTRENKPTSIEADSIIFHNYNPVEWDHLIQPSTHQIGFYSVFHLSDTIEIVDTTGRSVGLANLDGEMLVKFNGDSVTMDYNTYMNLVSIDSLLTTPKLTTKIQTDSMEVTSKGYVDSCIAAAVSGLAVASASTADTLTGQYNSETAGTLVYMSYNASLSPREDWNAIGKTDTTNAGRLLGISITQSTTEGTPVTSRNNDGEVLIRGVYTTSGLDTDDPIYYVGTSGNITNTRPSASDEVVRIIGYAISPTQLWFDPSKEWMVLE